MGMIDHGKVALTFTGAEWDATTVYDRLTVVNSGLSKYLSLQPDNVGHALTDGEWWQLWIDGRDLSQAIEDANIAAEAAEDASDRFEELLTDAILYTPVIGTVETLPVGQAARIEVTNDSVAKTSTLDFYIAAVTPEVAFVSVNTYGDLPATGSEDTIYRVASWDGTQVDPSAYAEYSWNDGQYKLLSVKQPGIDDEPVAGSNNLVKSGGIADTVLPYMNKVEFETSHITTTVFAFKDFLIDFKMLTEREDGYDYGLYHICNGLPEGVSYTYYLAVLKFPTGETPTNANVVAVATFSSTTKPDNGLIIFENSDSTVRAAALVNWDAVPVFGSGSNFVPFRNTSVFNQSYIFNLHSGIIPTILSLNEKIDTRLNNLVISLVGDNSTQNYDDVNVGVERYGAAVCLYNCIGKVFNTIEIPFYASSERNVSLRIGQTDIVNYSNDMFVDAMLEDNILLSTTFDIQGSAGYQKIHLESPISISKKTLVICTSTNSAVIYNPYQASSVGMIKNAGLCINNTGTIYIYAGGAEYNAYGVSPKVYLSTDYADVDDINKRLDAIQTVDVFLPDKLYAVVGDTFQLFYRGAIKAPNPFNYDIVAVCNKGSDYPRYYEYTPSASNVGTTSLTLYVKDHNRKILGQKSCALITVQASEPSSEKKILCFGDSLTSAGVWCHEADRRLTGTGGSPVGLGFSNISFCGKKTNEGTGYFGNGGWTWDSYTTEGRPAYRFYVNNVNTINIGAVYTNNGNTFTVIEVNVTDGTGNILCSVTSLSPAPLSSGTLTKSSGSGDDNVIYTSCAEDTQNPLWDSSNNKMSFIPYVEAYAGGNVDAVYVLLSWNGLTPGKTDFSTILANVKIFADTLHSEYPNAKLKLMGLQMNSVNGGMGANYGATGVYSDDYGMLTTAFNLNKAYQEFADNDDYSSFVEYVDIACQFDTDYNMQSRNKYVNTRNTAVTEVIGTNGVHPDTTGYYQIADVVFRNIVANFCQ